MGSWRARSYDGETGSPVFGSVHVHFWVLIFDHLSTPFSYDSLLRVGWNCMYGRPNKKRNLMDRSAGLQVCEWDDWAFPWNGGLVECGCPFVDRKWALARLCVGVRVNTSCPPCRRSSFGLIGIDLIDRFTSSPKWKHVKHVHVLWSSRFVACNWCQLIIGQNRVARSFIFNELSQVY